MDNNTRRQLLDRHRRSGFPGSIIDVYRAYDQGIDLIGQFEQQQQLQKQNIDVASTPQEVQQGLRPAHAAGDVNKSMLFPNIPPNTPFTTVGMKAPINIQKFDNQGHLVKSYENVPPGIKNLPMGPHQGTVLETPAQMKSGGVRKYQKGNFVESNNQYPVYNGMPTANLAAAEVLGFRTGTESNRPWYYSDETDYWEAQRPAELQRARESYMSGFPIGNLNPNIDPKLNHSLTPITGLDLTPMGDLVPFMQAADQALQGNYGTAAGLTGVGAASLFLPFKIQGPLRNGAGAVTPSNLNPRFKNVKAVEAWPNPYVQLVDPMQQIIESKLGTAPFESSITLRQAADLYGRDFVDYTLDRADQNINLSGIQNTTINPSQQLALLGAFDYLDAFQKEAIDLSALNRTVENLANDSRVGRPFLQSDLDYLYSVTDHPYTELDEVKHLMQRQKENEDAIFEHLYNNGLIDDTRDVLDIFGTPIGNYNQTSNLGFLSHSIGELAEARRAGIVQSNSMPVSAQLATNMNEVANKMFIPAPGNRIESNEYGTNALAQRLLERFNQERNANGLVLSNTPVFRGMSPENVSASIAEASKRGLTSTLGSTPASSIGASWSSFLGAAQRFGDQILIGQLGNREKVLMPSIFSSPKFHEEYEIMRDPLIDFDLFDLNADQYKRAAARGFKNGGVRKYQNGDTINASATTPDWRSTGPGLRINNQFYQPSQLTGSTRVSINPETGDQLPIMLPAAEVVGRRDYDDSIAEAVSRTNSGLLGSQTSAQDYAQMENAVRSGMNTAGNNMLAAAGDILSSPQRYAVNAPLAYAMGKTPNLSMFPSADRNVGINQPNAFPSETLGVTNPIGAFAVDALTDPTAIAGIGALGRAGVSRAKGLLRNASQDVNQVLRNTSLPSALNEHKLRFPRSLEKAQDWMYDWSTHPETRRRTAALTTHPLSGQPMTVTGGKPISEYVDNFDYAIQSGTSEGKNVSGYSSVHNPRLRNHSSPIVETSSGKTITNATLVTPDPYNPGRETSVGIHELTHSQYPEEFIKSANMISQYDPSASRVLDPSRSIFREGVTEEALSDLVQYEKTRSLDDNFLGYLANPTEQHARIMQLRHAAELTPGQHVSSKFVEALQYANSKDQIVDPKFFEIYKSPEALAKLFNTLPGLAPIAGGALATGTGIGLLNDNTTISPQMKSGGIRKAQAGIPPTVGKISPDWKPIGKGLSKRKAGGTKKYFK